MTSPTKCKHENVTLTETGSWITQHVLEEGEWEHNNEPGNYDATVHILCNHCGYACSYSKYAKYLPKWVLEKFLDLGLR